MRFAITGQQLGINRHPRYSHDCERIWVIQDWAQGAAIAEIFLQDLNTSFLAKPTEPLGYDFLVGFRNAKVE